MVKVSKIIEKLENFAPLNLQSEWDNSGWQIYLGDYHIKRVMLALSPSVDVIEQAVKNNCELIICHHPLFFSKVDRITVNNHTNLPVIKAIQNNIQIYSSHTNLDSVQNGVADELASLLGLTNLTIIEKTSENAGFGRIGELKEEIELDKFLSNLKSILKTDKLKLINPERITKIRKIAVCPGSAAEFWSKLKDVDLYITGDIKYHTALEMANIAVVDAGHMETEQVVIPVIKNLLKDFEIGTFIAEESSPWEIV